MGGLGGCSRMGYGACPSQPFKNKTDANHKGSVRSWHCSRGATGQKDAPKSDGSVMRSQRSTKGKLRTKGNSSVY
ncbi:hypothetical protein N656DRAFT_773745 [Canariomyces notabilis]|uniref:Uncharacterized protein n=1 Tax=Canariomyces notabilis TaxID=2074819 RepID=A0AAN6TN54_9PEZI|nr:hypothetical protein N656DRAFT_773745 [Canariomyces arenarius]